MAHNRNWRNRSAALMVAASLLTGTAGLSALFSSSASAQEASPAAATAPAAPDAARTAEAHFVELINALRARQGVQPLRVDPTLTDVARRWAAVMAPEGRIFHQSESQLRATPTKWKRLGENVGRGGDVISLQQAFEASPGHMANLVHPDYDAIGVGVVIVDGMIYVAEEFQDTPDAPPAAPAPATPLPATPPAASGARPAPSLATDAAPARLGLAAPGAEPRRNSSPVKPGPARAAKPAAKAARTSATASARKASARKAAARKVVKKARRKVVRKALRSQSGGPVRPVPGIAV